jgi:hypothetical protein
MTIADKAVLVINKLSSRTMQDMKLIINCGVGIILLLGLCACAAAQATQEQQLGRGGKWLSWTPVQRNTYVYGLGQFPTFELGDCNSKANGKSRHPG